MQVTIKITRFMYHFRDSSSYYSRLGIRGLINVQVVIHCKLIWLKVLIILIYNEPLIYRV